jgi:uncharacterized membrane protein YeaQ/YmgE (transglycosylase-associated protein family)
MALSFTQILIWIVLAAIIGVVGELIARRRTRGGMIGAILVGLLAIFLVVGVFHLKITGEPMVSGVPLLTSLLAAAVLVALWSAFGYRRVHQYAYARRYARRDGYERRRPRRRWF